MRYTRLFNLFFTLFLLCWGTLLSAQLTLRVTDLPSNTPANADIFIAGSLNGWDPGSADYKLSPDNDGILSITVNPPAGQIAFKFTRGSWTTVEGNEFGGYLPDRTFDYSGDETTVDLEILSWEDLGGGNNPHTATDNVTIIEESFYIPQLDRYRRIWVYLPPNYQSTTLDYPVLYMHDGQNLFDEFYSFSGEWMVDESLNQLFTEGDEGIIVVGIDNGGSSRLDEYSPWVNTTYGGGEGDEYMQFIVETLKPHIDNTYRTKEGRESTGMMGSSMGALISMYGAMEYQEVFSKAGLFSPAFWFAPEVYTHASSIGKEFDMKFYFLAGEQESTSMVANLTNMYTTLQQAGFEDDELYLITHPDGQHSEWYWAREFPDAYEWLFSDPVLNVAYKSPLNIKIIPNPAKDTLQIQFSKPLEEVNASIFSMEGRMILEQSLNNNGDFIEISSLPQGVYSIQITQKGAFLAAQQIAIKR